MINKENVKEVLTSLGFEAKRNVYSKHFVQGDFSLKVDFDKSEIVYPENKGFTVNERQTCNFSSSENFVVFECVHRLLMKGYKPEHIELEPKWKLGHGASGGRADILVRDQQSKPLLIIECKTAGKEFERAWKDTQLDGGQLFSYIEQEKDIEFVCLYASNFDEKNAILSIEQRIISHKDNAKILADDPKLKPFKDAKNVKERFKVWKETYQLEYTEKGIFEENIQPYQIGKDKYTLEIDTKEIESSDIKGKYHQFRTILRKYNVSRRENAFEVLVNLFLCKLVDELENPNDLKFYWKGIAYDNYFDLVDRLQELYKIGMERFLDQEITYVSNDEIEDAFWAIKQKRNATKQRIKDLFKTLKFFNDNSFGFIGVKNKQGFEKNAKILLEIIQMWQGLRLKTKEQNQFLGDMFEYFLDNGIKQSEGQFFTPVPICKFIVMSLPLESQIQASNEALKAIDYACGSGHFLTEYALQIKPLVRQYKQTEPTEYYKNIYGIEKEDRLAKVAKVSAFMYGRDEIKVFDADALASNHDIKNDSFDVLIANPPFAVEDFLLTLEESDREKYELLQTVSDIGNKNIQCFFLERAKQLLAANGTMGVIVPSSVLSNSDSMHVATREILLKYFDFVSIVELGSGTFGKTGTNTVVLFLRRKPQRPEPSEHFWNRTQDFFDNWEQESKTSGGAFMDAGIVKNYCQHIEIPFETYQSLLLGEPSAELLGTEMFNDYKADFEKSAEIVNLKERFRKQEKDLPKNLLAEIRKERSNTKKSDSDIDLEKKVQALLPQKLAALRQIHQTALRRRFLAYLQEIEKKKLYYFMLANSNPSKVLIVKSPSDNKEQKQFLGYEWSGSKGSEGIKYNGGDTIHDIITLMFDPRNRNNTQKINYHIQQNFEGKPLSIPDDLRPFMTSARLEDLLDFSRKDFNKAVSLAPKKNVAIETQWDLVKLGEVAEIQSGGTPSSEKPEYWDGDINWATLVDTKQKYLYSTQRKITAEGLKNSSAKLLPINTVIFSSRATIGDVTIAKVETATNQGYKNFICDESKIKHEFLYEMLKMFASDIAALAGGMTFKEISKTEISNFRIPLPPITTQKQIVMECDAIDKAVKEAQQLIVQEKKEIDEIIVNGTFSKEKLGNVAKKVSENIDPQSHTGEVNYVGLENIESNTGTLVGSTKTEYQTIKSAKTVFKKGDILYGKLRPNLNKVYLAQEGGICSTDILVFRFGNEELAKFYSHYLLSMPFNKEVLKSVSGQQLPRTSWTDMKEIKILFPSQSEQKPLIKKLEKIEQRISAAQKTINESASLKQAVIKQYL